LQLAGVATNFLGGVAGSRFGLFCTLLASLFLQIVCLVSPVSDLTENITLTDWRLLPALQLHPWATMLLDACPGSKAVF